MNIYEKLQTCRVELQHWEIKKSGQNKFSGYSYYELADFLPIVNKIFLEKKLCSVISFTAEAATLTIINIEKPEERITITSPMAEAKLKACHEIQNLGAVESYQRRYLYLAALEIVEHDVLDATTGKEEDIDKKPSSSKPPSKPPSKPSSKSAGSEMATEKQQKAIYAIGKSAGFTEKGIKGIISQRYDDKKTAKDLKKKEASDLIEYFKRWEKIGEICDKDRSIMASVKDTLEGRDITKLSEEEFEDITSYAADLTAAAEEEIPF